MHSTPMDLSLAKSEQSQDRKKVNEAASVIAEQQKAAEASRAMPLRTFRLETVTIDTISGQPLVTKMWATNEEQQRVQKKEKEIYKCEFCEKTFDKRQKMLLHARFHIK